jgi:hypothetical protein
LCVLFTETIICSKTETSTEGRFLMKAGFLKHKKVSQAVPGTVRRTTAPKSAPKLEAVNLMQKSETMKNVNAALSKQADLGGLDTVAKALANKPTSPNDPAPLDLNIGTGPIWVTGWIKYFKYFPSAKTLNLTPNNTPRQFMINPNYNEQYKVDPKFDKKKKSKDELGNDLAVYITDKNKFYSKLMKDQIIILSARDVKIYFIIILINYLVRN